MPEARSYVMLCYKFAEFGHCSRAFLSKTYQAIVVNSVAAVLFPDFELYQESGPHSCRHLRYPLLDWDMSTALAISGSRGRKSQTRTQTCVWCREQTFEVEDIPIHDC